jgi:hypothetical protein
MEFNWVLLLFGALWLLSKMSEKARQKQKPDGERRRSPRTGVPPSRPPLSHQPATLDATQREGTRLELVLRELQRGLEQAETLGGSTTIRLPPVEEMEERESLEVEPEVRSLESEVRRAGRQEVDQDEDAEQIEARRIAAAAARDAPRSKSDHAGFDERIRQQPADHTATRGYTPQQLRDAMVWREILGPPVSLREERER